MSEYLGSIGFDFAPSMTQLLFGFHELSFDHPKNYISILLKKFIWSNKFHDCHLSLVRFKGLLKVHVLDLKYIFRMKNEDNKFEKWKPIESAL